MNKWELSIKELVSKEIYIKLKKYVNLILEKNLLFNLTGFNEDEIWREGIFQSIFILSHYINENNIKLVDIGAGVGFPSIPFYIFKDEQINLTIYEPIRKRVDFLNLVIKELGLKNINVIQKRIEESNACEEFDYITARAVMSLNKLIEVSTQCGKIGSKYVFLKSKSAFEEYENSREIINELNISNFKIEKIDIKDNKEHNIVLFSKLQPTPKKFPRSWNEILKSERKKNENK